MNNYPTCNYLALLDAMYLWYGNMLKDDEGSPFGAALLCSVAIFLNGFSLFNVFSFAFGTPFILERWIAYMVGIPLMAVNWVIAFRRYRQGAIGLRLDRKVFWGRLGLIPFAKLYFVASIALFYASTLSLWGRGV